MRSELLDWLHANGLVLLSLVLSFETAYLFGYLVLSDFPFMQFADFTLVSWVTSQTILVALFIFTGLLFNTRLNLIEGQIPLGRLVERGRTGILLLYFLGFLLALLIFVGDLRPGLIGFLAANALVIWLYHPTETSSIGSVNYPKLFLLLRISPRRTWRIAMKPFYVLMFRNCAWLFGVILFAWIGFLRFSALANYNVQLLNIDGVTVELSIVGQNSIGLIAKNNAGDYFVYPTGAISSISVPTK